MKKTLALLLVAGSAISLSACGSLPTCNEDLDECTFGGPYTEERTIQAGTRTAAKPAPAPTPAPAPAPAPVVAAPAPAPIVTPTIQAPAPVYNPAPVYDGAIMRSAEPEFKQISK